MHNFIVLPVLILENFIQSVGITTALCTAKIINECFLALSKKNQDKKKAQAQKIIENNKKSNNQSNNNGNNRPPKRDKPNNNKLRELAAALGFVETKDYDFNSHGQLVFRLGKKYLSYDIDGHVGGFWKLLTKISERYGSYTEDLLQRLGD